MASRKADTVFLREIWRSITIGNMLPLHADKPSLIPGTIYDSQCPIKEISLSTESGVILEHRWV